MNASEKAKIPVRPLADGIRWRRYHALLSFSGRFCPLHRDFFDFSLGLGNLEAGCLFGCGFFGKLLETVDAAGGIDEFLLAGIERVALRTDFRVHFFDGRAGNEHCSARAGDGGFFEIGWVYSCLHMDRDEKK